MPSRTSVSTRYQHVVKRGRRNFAAKNSKLLTAGIDANHYYEQSIQSSVANNKTDSFNQSSTISMKSSNSTMQKFSLPRNYILNTETSTNYD